LKKKKFFNIRRNKDNRQRKRIPQKHIYRNRHVTNFFNRKQAQNAGFIECNILNGGLPFPSNTFDFVHQLLLYAAFTERQWSQEIIRVLKPSGYAEFMESDVLNF